MNAVVFNLSRGKNYVTWQQKKTIVPLVKIKNKIMNIIIADYLKTTLAQSDNTGPFLTSVFSRGLEETSHAHFPKTALR